MEVSNIIQVVVQSSLSSKLGIAPVERFFYFTDDEKFVKFVRSLPKGVLLTVGTLAYRFNPSIDDVDKRIFELNPDSSKVV